MSLITLKDIGKIYVSANNVAVGIRGVNLSFDKGEFVAITGKSGSGKSTLLNVISGMDSYEEGEMFVDGEPTSHYLQADWEEYRQKYISFIFQDYNIIESFTVLQNVELALMHIENPKERRTRALELLHRVGLEKHLHHKGSKLSGGQKQRTVIARALAKDSPIILADEPTGNLDSQTSKEIIELLREVSLDKLVIIVTHNFEQVEAYATRHVRVFDGAIEADQHISAPAELPSAASEQSAKQLSVANKAIHHYKSNLRKGLTLGRVRFLATPKLSIFLCILMILSSLAVTFVTSLSGDALGLFDKNYIFTHKDGRVVLIRQDGAVITDDELESLATSVGANSYMHYDFLLDMEEWVEINHNYYEFQFSYDNFDGLDVGRKPEKENEVILRVPVSLKIYYGASDFTERTLTNVFGIVDYQVVGIDYFYDNTKTPEIVFTAEGYKTASALAYLSNSLYDFKMTLNISDNLYPATIWEQFIEGQNMHVSFDIGDGSYYINYADYTKALLLFEENKKSSDNKEYSYKVSTALTGTFVSYNYSNNPYDDGYIKSVDVSIAVNPNYGSKGESSSSLEMYKNLDNVSDEIKNLMAHNNYQVMLSPDIIEEFMAQHYYSKVYTQASLFFDNDIQAGDKTNELKNLGYTAVSSVAVNEVSGLEVIVKTLQLLFKAFGWAITVVFIAMFISLCSSRTMLATKGDIAILRSMGISTPVVKVSIYIQTLISLVPAYVVTAIAAIVIFMTPKTNAIFLFLHAWEYIVIAVALFAICLLLSKRYVKKMFDSSVKKTMKGDVES